MAPTRGTRTVLKKNPEINFCDSFYIGSRAFSFQDLQLYEYWSPRNVPKMCTAGQRVSLTITGPGPSFSGSPSHSTLSSLSLLVPLIFLFPLFLLYLLPLTSPSPLSPPPAPSSKRRSRARQRSLRWRKRRCRRFVVGGNAPSSVSSSART